MGWFLLLLSETCRLIPLLLTTEVEFPYPLPTLPLPLAPFASSASEAPPPTPPPEEELGAVPGPAVLLTRWLPVPEFMLLI